MTRHDEYPAEAAKDKAIGCMAVFPITCRLHDDTGGGSFIAAQTIHKATVLLPVTRIFLEEKYAYFLLMFSERHALEESEP